MLTNGTKRPKNILKVYKGGAGLTNSDREALVWGAKVIADERGKTFSDTLQSYKDLSGKYDFDEETITRGLTPHRSFIGGGPSQGTVRVRRSDGQTGTIDAADFDPAKYEKL